jgi:hypothetical protein
MQDTAPTWDWADPVVLAWLQLRVRKLEDEYGPRSHAAWAAMSEPERVWLAWLCDEMMSRRPSDAESRLLNHICRDLPSPLIFHDRDPYDPFDL